MARIYNSGGDTSYEWEVTLLAYGQPVARSAFRTILECVRWIVAYDADRAESGRPQFA